MRISSRKRDGQKQNVNCIKRWHFQDAIFFIGCISILKYSIILRSMKISKTRKENEMKKCELLVPAGGSEQFVAAVENGADAIYIGGKEFNARINAGNFDDEELKEAVDFAHKRGVKVHVTMNTLLTDDEVVNAIDYVKFLYCTGVDALIIQDLGLADMVRKHFPDFEIHLSTQGTVYSVEGVKAAAKLGFSRVVLSRELSLQEIEDICAQTQIEIEVFAHGALCICYSGQCQMSRYFGGRSGNRGQCAQPCRLPYKTLDKDGRLLDTHKYPLSPKDLCQIENIGPLIEAGVASLKIEGRMKSAEYVAIVTSIYRRYIDKYLETGTLSVREEDVKQLMQIFNRGGFTQGYLYEDPKEHFMAGDIPKHRGIKIGKVVKQVNGTSLVDIKLYDELKLGDGIEIQGNNIVGNIVTYIKPLKSGLTRIGDMKGRVDHGDLVYKISSKEQLKCARDTYKNKNYNEGKYVRKTLVDMSCEIDSKGCLTLKAHTPLLKTDVLMSAGPFDKVPENPTDVMKIKDGLEKMGNTPFLLGEFTFTGENDRKIPISAINDLRRKTVNVIEEKLIFRRKSEGVTAIEVPKNLNENTYQNLEIYCYSWEAYENFRIPEGTVSENQRVVYLVPIVEMYKHRAEIPTDKELIPYISNVSKGEENRWIESNFDEIIKLCDTRGIYIGNLEWLDKLSQSGIKIYGDYGLNQYNNFARDVLKRIGITPVSGSLEALEEGFGALPLMISQHQPDGEILIDRKKEMFDMIKKDYSEQTIIIPGENNLDWEKIRQAISTGTGVVRIFATKSGI